MKGFGFDSNLGPYTIVYLGLKVLGLGLRSKRKNFETSGTLDKGYEDM